MRKTLLALCLTIAYILPVNAQFYLPGDDPGHLRWYSIQTPHYQIIFPDGADTLARTFGRRLEQFRPAVGRSLDLTPGIGREKMPVVLHTHHITANGSMGWAPSRMDLFTFTDPYGSDPVSWDIQLAAHEPRHQSQMEYSDRGWLKVVTGEGWSPIHWQLFMEQAIAEGDAVVAETGIANGTRARTADFLNYFRVALDQGDYRSWDRWRYGSYKLSTPDLYKVGYMTVAGARVLYDDPLIVRKALDTSRRKPWMVAPANFRSQIRAHSGKPFRESFRDIEDFFNRTWQADDAARAPFLKQDPAVSMGDTYAIDYVSPQYLDGVIYALRSGNRYTDELIEIRDGKARRIASFNSHSSSLFAEEEKHRLYWSETIRDPRWGLAGTSIIRYYEPGTGKMRDLTRGTRYYNPQPSPDGSRLAVADYPVSGNTAAVILDADSGAVLQRFPAPEGQQVAEFAWMGEELYASLIGPEGSSIMRVLPSGVWESVLAPSAQKVVNLGNGDDCIEWVSDRTGVNELYNFYPHEGRLVQLTSTRYGATDFCEIEDQLWYSAQTLEGMQLFCTPMSELTPKEVTYTDLHRYAIEDALTAQERALGEPVNLEEAVPMSAPKRYYKLANALRLHTWLPLYVNYDAVKEGSMDFSYETASIGLTGFFQNNLGTLSGMVGYGLHPDPDEEGHWRNSLHLQVAYTGLYPVIEASVDFGDEAARQYIVRQNRSGLVSAFGTAAFAREAPLLSGQVRTYVPLSYSKGGLLWGVTPQLRYSFSNNLFATDPVVFTAADGFDGIPSLYALSSVGDRTSVWMSRLSGSVRGYVMMPRADAQVYPRWGLGLEAGVSVRPSLQRYFAPNAYGYAYGYLPGFTRNQGLRLTGMVQSSIGNDLFGDLAVNTLPRGWSSVAGAAGRSFPRQWKLTADYAIPIYLGDISIPWVAYITHFILTPHADIAGFSSRGSSGLMDKNLWSVGADLTASLARLLCLPFDATVGISTSYLGGTWRKPDSPWSIEMVFGVDF